MAAEDQEENPDKDAAFKNIIFENGRSLGEFMYPDPGDPKDTSQKPSKYNISQDIF